MTRDEIFRGVQLAVKRTFSKVDLDAVTTTTHLKNDLGADSVDSMSLIICLEEQFGASIPIESPGEIETIGQVVDVIELHLKQTANPTAVVA